MASRKACHPAIFYLFTNSPQPVYSPHMPHLAGLTSETMIFGIMNFFILLLLVCGFQLSALADEIPSPFFMADLCLATGWLE